MVRRHTVIHTGVILYGRKSRIKGNRGRMLFCMGFLRIVMRTNRLTCRRHHFKKDLKKAKVSEEAVQGIGDSKEKWTELFMGTEDFQTEDRIAGGRKATGRDTSGSEDRKIEGKELTQD